MKQENIDVSADKQSELDSKSFERQKNDLPIGSDVQLSLDGVFKRLTEVESRLSQDGSAGKGKSKVLEFVTTLLTSWPALGFVFLIMFYIPLRSSLDQLPAKIKSSTELGVGGILTLKATIVEEAERQGAPDLSNTLPNLSGVALRNLLVREPAGHGGLVMRHLGGKNNKLVLGVSFPTKENCDALDELQRFGLIKLSGIVVQNSPYPNTYSMFEQFKLQNPGSLGQSFDKSKELWHLSTPVETLTLPDLSWELTPTGTKAVDVILQATANKLASEHSDRKKVNSTKQE